MFIVEVFYCGVMYLGLFSVEWLVVIYLLFEFYVLKISICVGIVLYIVDWKIDF